MANMRQERRGTRRYELHLPVHFRVSQKGIAGRWGTGLTRDISTSGLSFRTRKPLPVGSHIELIVDWPAKYAETHPIDLQLTGFVLRSDNSRTAVRITSHRFRIGAQPLPYRATA
jgi:PilZ domain